VGKIKTSEPVSEWLRRRGPGYPYVLSSRARLARNVAGIPFPHSASEEELERARGVVLEAVAKAVDPSRELSMNFAEELSRDELEFMAEERIVSRAFAENPKGRAIVLKSGASWSIVVNEEDHARIQTILPGAQFIKVWEDADKIDSRLESQVQYCFDHRLGYLTSCPTNVGTGLRVSAMLHLPALSITGEIAKTIAALSAHGVYVRGLYGEGSGVAGNLYQLSNRKTLGLIEEQIALKMESVVRQVADKERTERKVLLKERFIDTADRVSRALGVIERAKRLYFYEALELLSLVKMGLEMELLHVRDFNLLEVGVGICPQHLRRMLPDAKEEDVDCERASQLRRLLDL